MRAAALVLALVALGGCVLDLDRLRGDAAIGADAGRSDAVADAADAADGASDASDGGPEDGRGDAGPELDATPGDDAAPGDVRPGDGGPLAPYDAVPPCATGWRLVLDEGFDGDLDGWTAPGRAWRVEGGAATVSLDGLDDYWTNHLYRTGLDVDELAIVADVSGSRGAWPQVHLHLDPAAHDSRFLGVRLNDLGDDLHLFRQDAPVNNTDPIAHAVLPALDPDRLYRWVIALVALDGARVRVTAGVYPLDPPGPRIGERLEAELTRAEAYAGGSVGFSGWAGDVRVDAALVFGCP